MTKNRIKLKNTPQVQKYNRALREGLQSYHVFKRDGEWAIKRVGGKKASGVFDTQKEALDEAQKLARNNNRNLIVHKRNGGIREVRRYR